MKYLLMIATLLTLHSCSSVPFALNEKVYVVQRERESVAVFKGTGQLKTIEELGNLNHAIIKFKNGFAYVLARNGFLSKVDVKEDKLINKVKVGKSGIGITFTNDQIVIVNYDPNSVVVLDLDLNIQKNIETNSRNVGVKVWKNYLIFSLMDKNEIWILDIQKDFSLVKKFENVGNLPFDALLNDHVYIVGFFNEASVGMLDLAKLSYSKVIIKDSNEQLIYKVPHFGYWGVVGDKVFVPMVTDTKLLVLDITNMNSVGSVDLMGMPVFATLSPDKKILAVNYSGDKEDYISIIDTKTQRKITDLKVAKRVMHLRFSKDGKQLLVTSYFENLMHVYNVGNWSKLVSLPVTTPSGIFIEDSN